jgi:purine nucleosidase
VRRTGGRAATYARRVPGKGAEEAGLAAIPIVLDTDGGIDDCTALWYALTEPALEVVAVTVVRGVVGVAQAARNVAKVLHAAGREDVPVALGADEPYGPGPDLSFRAGWHGADGLGDSGLPDIASRPVDEPAPALLTRLTAERPGELTLVSVGPCTNVARALDLDPGLAVRVRELVVMGGTAFPPGNTTPWGEFNAVFDPTATAATVEALWARPPLLVGLDVTRRAVLTAGDVALAGEGRTAAARFLAPALRFALARRAAPVGPGDGGVPSHDTLAVMAVAHPDVVTGEELPLRVDTGGSAAWGATVVDLRARSAHDEALFAGAARWRIALDVDVDGFQARVRRMLGPPDGP